MLTAARRQYRYRTLLALGASLQAELDYTQALALAHLKTYQVWHHRRLLLSALGPERAAPAAELAFVTRVLGVDAKNYHSWSFRQWVLAHFDREELWSGELDFVEGLLEDDVRNNSAWHHRFFVAFERAGAGEVAGDIVRRELTYVTLPRRLATDRVNVHPRSFVKQKIALAPNNMSAWNYLRGVLDRTRTPYAREADFVRPYTGAQAPLAFDGVVDVECPPPSQGSRLPAVHALEFLADVYEAEGGEDVQKSVQVSNALALRFAR
jgi:protein farnesyltransferase/geranylgeranyltransferase type-1 subunit alpha